jgi:hypothetical protein
MAAKCSICGAETIMFISNSPVCVDCDDRTAERPGRAQTAEVPDASDGKPDPGATVK